MLLVCEMNRVNGDFGFQCSMSSSPPSSAFIQQLSLMCSRVCFIFAQAANKQCMCRETSASKLNGEEGKTNTHKKGKYCRKTSGNMSRKANKSMWSFFSLSIEKEKIDQYSNGYWPAVNNLFINISPYYIFN